MAKENPSSRIPHFYRMPVDQRWEAVMNFSRIARDPALDEKAWHQLSVDTADHMIENVISIFGLPLGIAANFLINDREYLIPMVIEEPSVVAGASFMAKLARSGGGFQASASEPEMIGQIQILGLDDLEAAETAILDDQSEILRLADKVDPVLVELGGGARRIEVRRLVETPTGPMLVVHLVYDTRDAMGANAVNSALEAVSPRLEQMTGGRAHLRILSNLSDQRLSKATVSIPVDELAFEGFTGQEVRDGIIDAWAFAVVDPYRAATHNKGIMNGVDAVVIATGNDWRAIEAGAHAYAAREGQYTSLSRWGKGPGDELVGTLEMPMSVGTVGGATRVHPTARLSLAILGVENSRQLAEVIVSVGLAQNLAALRALASEGIQRGHMSLHARQVAMAAGAEGDQVEEVARQMVAESNIHIDRAQELLAE